MFSEENIHKNGKNDSELNLRKIRKHTENKTILLDSVISIFPLILLHQNCSNSTK